MNNKITFNYNNVDYVLYNTKRYKSININIMFVKSMKKEDFTYYTLLNRIMCSSTLSYPTKKDLYNKMYELYDASIDFSTNYAFETAYCSLRLQILNGKLVNDEHLLENAINLLQEIIFNPNVINGEFAEKVFNEEKRSLVNDIKSIYNNKRKYAYKKMLELMYPNNILSSSQLGDLTILETITPKTLYEFYEQLLRESVIKIGVAGDIIEEEVKKHFSILNFNSIKYGGFSVCPLNITFNNEIKYDEEYQDISQTKLMMGFKFDIDLNHELYVPLLIFNSMFGGMFSSTLFKVIREEYSLTYDISSEIVLSKKILVVSCGIQKGNEKKVSDIVCKELEKYRNGDVDLDLFNVAKKFLINDIREMEDSLNAVLNYELESMISKKKSLKEIVHLINNVSIDTIKAVSQGIFLDTIFALKPGDDDE